MYKPLEPTPEFIKCLCKKGLLDNPGYPISEAFDKIKIKLDQNESPVDISEELKDKILVRLKERNWNRYPKPYVKSLINLVAQYAQVPEDCVVLAPGSNYLITTLLSLFVSKTTNRAVIARPSFGLYESFCKYEEIPYITWNLNQDLEYDLQTLPELTKNDVLIFASPNNPVGNSLSINDLEKILQQNKDTLVIADEAYFEFSSQPYTKLLALYSNLILIRTFSKTLGAAGVRLGYVLCAKMYRDQIIKSTLPFLLNNFTVTCMEELLGTDVGLKKIKDTSSLNTVQRDKVLVELKQLAESNKFILKNSEANFFYLKFKDNQIAKEVHLKLIAAGILIRNVSMGAGLTGGLRMTIGTNEENIEFIKAFKDIVVDLQV